MPLEAPNLDDRDFGQLVEEARRHIAQACPAWTDLSPGDPGITLLEVFAYLTELMLYRLNRLPEKAYIEFLRLMGAQIQPPAAARVLLRFTLNGAPEPPVEVPRGTRVTVARSAGGGEAPVFVTAETVTLSAARPEHDVPAYHCDLVQGELAGVGTGLPGVSVAARQPPIVAPTQDGLELIVGVEADPAELTARTPAWQWEDKAYRLWREVVTFAGVSTDDPVYVADRVTGTITFAPAVQALEAGQLQERRALAQAPLADRQIRLWYRRGGGPDGNVAAHTLTTLKDPLPRVQVTNPAPAAGGRAAETLDNALLRAPLELRTPQAAVTAGDFERVALAAGVARARAITRKALWIHATPGTVEVLLVPYLPDEAQHGGRVSAARIREFEVDSLRQGIQQALDERRPLGTTCLANWVRYKAVHVQARVVVHRGEDGAAVRKRILDRLYQTINPLPTRLHSGWAFGRPLRASDVYDVVLAERGVSYLDGFRLLVDEVPDSDVLGLAADAFQPRTWYAAAGPMLFRSGNDGDGWEPVGRFPGEPAARIRVHPDRPGLLAVVAKLPGDAGGSRLYVSRDCGETWDRPWAETAFTVADVAWILRDEIPVLLLATDVGLYELAEGSSPVPVLVNPADPQRGFTTVTTTETRGMLHVAVAARGTSGVFLSAQGGRPSTFQLIGLKGDDVRVLAVQRDGVRSYLWAGLAVAGTEAGKGCCRWELRGAEPSPEGWRWYPKGWKGGSCLALAFQGTKVLAATHREGVLGLDAAARDPAWQAPDFTGSRLPLRDEGRFQPVTAVAVDPGGRLLLAGGPKGVYRSADQGVHYEECSRRDFSDRVTLPETWLFCSGEHVIEVVSEDEAARAR